MDSRQTLWPLGSSQRNQWLVSHDSAVLVRAPITPSPVTVQAGDRAVTFDLARTAIIVVDMQNDFCHPQGWLGHKGIDVAPARAPIAPLARLLPQLRAADVPVIWLNWGNRPDRLNLSPALMHVYKPTGEGVGLGDPLPGSGAKVLEAGSWAASIVDELETSPADVHVAKYRMSGFQDTALDSILRNLNVTTLLFAGVNADQCVLCTLQDANFRGYDCLLLEDCSATTSPDYCMAATLYNVRQCFGFVTDSVAVSAGLERSEDRGI
jgi:nicotinamidase-related amidase